jgi:hypothetical protein
MMCGREENAGSGSPSPLPYPTAKVSAFSYNTFKRILTPVTKPRIEQWRWHLFVKICINEPHTSITSNQENQYFQLSEYSQCCFSFSSIATAKPVDARPS